MLSIQNNVRYLFDLYNYYTTPTETLEQWVANSPPEEKRGVIADKIKEACSTGTLTLRYSVVDNITRLPEMPEEIKSVKIIGARKLHSLPSLKAVTELKIEDYPNLKINKLPLTLKKLSINNVGSISELPHELFKLTIKSITLPVLPKEVSELKIEQCNGVLDIAELTSLKKLDISFCKNLEISSLPKNLEFISIQGNLTGCASVLRREASCLSPSANKDQLPKLPEGLLELSLKNINELVSVPTLPDNLKKLTLAHLPSANKFGEFFPPKLESLTVWTCPSLNLPTLIPSTLSEINIQYSKTTHWDISPDNIPPGAELQISGVIINPDCYKRKDVKFDNIYTESSLRFKAGDVLYGLSSARGKVGRIINKLNNNTEKDIVIQNTLTNAVWDREYYWRFNPDNEIRSTLNDGERGIAFRNFIGSHKMYNVTDKKFSKLSDIQRWTKTSKAGLEFQTKVRGGKVIFCADLLVDSIPDIASKKDSYGDAITAHELRWLYRHRNEDYVKDNVIFSLNGEVVSHDTIFTLRGWEIYHPKNSNI